MATTFKLANYDKEVKVRRLFWKEANELRKKLDTLDDFELMEEILKRVVEPKEALEYIDVYEARKIMEYAWGSKENLND